LFLKVPFEHNGRQETDQIQEKKGDGKGAARLQLCSFYREYLERFRDAVKNITVHDLLGLMCVAREPLTLEMVSLVLGKNKKMTQIIEIEAQQLLVLTGGEIRFVHTSMSDYLQGYLRNQDDTMQLEEKIHHQLATFCSENLKTSDLLLGTLRSILPRLANSSAIKDALRFHMA